MKSKLELIEEENKKLHYELLASYETIDEMAYKIAEYEDILSNFKEKCEFNLKVTDFD